MNQSFYESRSKEKINDIMKEGMMSQAYYRSRTSEQNFFARLPKLILIILVVAWIIQLIVS